MARSVTSAGRKSSGGTPTPIPSGGKRKSSGGTPTPGSGSRKSGTTQAPPLRRSPKRR